MAPPRPLTPPFVCPATGHNIAAWPRRGQAALPWVLGVLALALLLFSGYLMTRLGGAMKDAVDAKAAQVKAEADLKNLQAETNLRKEEAAQALASCQETKRALHAGHIAFIAQELERKKKADAEMNPETAAKVMDTIAAARMQYPDDMEIAAMFREAFGLAIGDKP